MASPRPLPAIHRLAPGVYYGWFVALGTALVSFTVVGIGFYGMVVFLDALCADRGWSRVSVSAATSLYWITTGVVGSLIGRSVDRYGPRAFIAGGAALMGLALLALARVTEPWQLYPVYVLLGIGFAFAGNVTSGALVTHWFVDRRARAMSISHTGVSVGGMLLVPLARGLIEDGGLATAATALAVLVVCVVWPVAALVLRTDPVPYGLEVDGRSPDQPEPLGSLSLAAQRRVWSRREVLRTRSFWLLSSAYSAMLFCQVAVGMHQLALLRGRLDPASAAWALSLTAAGSLVARLVVGSFADRIHKPRLAVGLFALQAVAIAIFARASDAPTLYAGSLIFGFTVGNIFMLQHLIVAELFGIASIATVMGMVLFASQFASGLGPLVLGLLADAAGGYRAPLQGLLAIVAVAALLLLQVRPPEPPTEAR